MNISLAASGDEHGIALAHMRAWQAAYRGIVSDKFLDAMRVADRITRWREILQNPACKLLVAKQATETLGFVSFGRSRETNAKTTDGEIWTMYVCPSSWRGGVGKSLMNEALAWLGQEGFKTVSVWVLKANAQAIGFYSSCGFELQPYSARYFDLGGQQLEEVALQRRNAA